MSSAPQKAAPDLLRAFVAVPLPSALVEGVARLQDRLRRLTRGDNFRWTRPHQWHLTLRFLGDLSLGQVDEVRSRLDTLCEKSSEFTLSLGALGCFPNPRAARVLWLGVAGELDALRSLHRAVVAALEGLRTHGEDTRFHPHLTLARIRSVTALGDLLSAGQTETAPLAAGEWTVRTFELIRSELRPGGSHYTTLASFDLRAGEATGERG